MYQLYVSVVSSEWNHRWTIIYSRHCRALLPPSFLLETAPPCSSPCVYAGNPSSYPVSVPRIVTGCRAKRIHHTAGPTPRCRTYASYRFTVYCTSAPHQTLFSDQLLPLVFIFIMYVVQKKREKNTLTLLFYLIPKNRRKIHHRIVLLSNCILIQIYLENTIGPGSLLRTA